MTQEEKEVRARETREKGEQGETRWSNSLLASQRQGFSIRKRIETYGDCVNFAGRKRATADIL